MSICFRHFYNKIHWLIGICLFGVYFVLINLILFGKFGNPFEHTFNQREIRHNSISCPFFSTAYFVCDTRRSKLVQSWSTISQMEDKTVGKE